MQHQKRGPSPSREPRGSSSYPNRAPRKQPSSSSWEPVEQWYKNSVGEEGHYYHQHVEMPGIIKLLAVNGTTAPKILDLACGPGVLSGYLPKSINYTGVDIAPSLVKAARAKDKNAQHQYHVADAMKALPIKETDFTHIAIVLAIQNMEEPKKAFFNAAKHLIRNGHLVVVMNHPCFRIPRQSSWKVDDQQKVQYRRIDRYSSALNIPIQAHPSKGEQSETTWSYHFPLEAYSQWLFDTGFAIELIEEWHSDKVSVGGAAKMENRSREEIPMFLAIRAIKIRD